MRAWKEDLNFRELVLNDPEITKKVPRSKIEHAFDLQRQLKNIDKIFVRVFPAKTRGKASAKTLTAPARRKKRIARAS
jgi:hypothetical protein